MWHHRENTNYGNVPLNMFEKRPVFLKVGEILLIDV
jgi:hypothetical protein